MEQHFNLPLFRHDTNPPNYGSKLSDPQLTHQGASGDRTRSALLTGHASPWAGSRSA